MIGPRNGIHPRAPSLATRAASGAIACLLLIAAATLAGCGGSGGGGGSGYGSGSAPTLFASGSSAPAIDDGQSITITANTDSSQGVTWSLTGRGTLTSQTATSATFNAPASGDATSTVTATLVSDASKTASMTIAITASPSIATTSLPDALIGLAYNSQGNQQIAVTGGSGVLTFMSSAGSLPAGLTLDSKTGLITGVPAGPASTTPSSFTVKVTDSSTAGAESAIQLLSIRVDQVPAITSANHATFEVGTAGTFSVTTSGVPAPSLNESGALPLGVTLVDNGNGTATLSGTPGPGTAANYAFTLNASNGAGTAATQSFTLTVIVGQPLAITSANNALFTVTISAARFFTVTTTGFPKPALAETGPLPAGISFTDNGDGTASIHGRGAIGAGGVYSIMITAHNGIGADAVQVFTLTVAERPTITNTNNVRFTAGVPAAFVISATGYPPPHLTASGILPSGVILRDNGNGTATLGGTPGPTSGGQYLPTITADNMVDQSYLSSFVVTVDQPASIASAATTTFSVGQPNTFTLTASGLPAPSILESGPLPSGVTLRDNGNGTATLSGIPASATAGSYPFTFTASNGVGAAANQNFTLSVTAGPAFTSTGGVTFELGVIESFTVTTTGPFSGPSVPALTESGPLPGGITFKDNGNSTGTLSGIASPGTAGSYPITFTASNNLGPPANQSFTLIVTTVPVFTSADSTNFTQGINGTFLFTTAGSPFHPSIPRPYLTESGPLPSGVRFLDNGDGTANLYGTPSSGGAVFRITVTACLSGCTSQNFVLAVNQNAGGLAGAATFTENVFGSYLLASAGQPPASITVTQGTIPSGVTFTDNRDGTATVSGTPATGTSGFYPLILIVNNGVGTTSNGNFDLTVTTAVRFTSPGSATFTTGSNDAFTVTTSSAMTPGLYESGRLPTGVTFLNNRNGTATLAGTPARGSGGIYPITIRALNDAGTDSQSFTLIVDEAPAITSATDAMLVVGETGNFGVSTLGFPAPALAETGTLPTGVSFTDNGDGTAALSGTPASGTGGPYAITINSANGVGSNDTQSFTLTVLTDPCQNAGTGNESLLNGNYVFALQGFDNGAGPGETQPEPALVGGVLAFNGSGAVTSGTLDTNFNGTAGVSSNLLISGTYKVGSDQRTCITITTSAGTQHYKGSLSNISSGAASTGHLLEFDTSGPFTAGVLRKQSGSIPTVLSANFAFAASSAQNSAHLQENYVYGGKFAIVGVFGFSPAGTLSPSSTHFDFNGNGGLDIGNGSNCNSFASCVPLTVNNGASYSISANGRGTLAFFPSGTSLLSPVHTLFYVVSPTELILLSSDDQTKSNLFMGEALLQTDAPFSISSLNGTGVVYQSKPDICTTCLPATGTDAAIGTFTWNGSGVATAGTLWSLGPRSAAPISSQSVAGATYSVDPSGDGRVLLSDSDPNPPVLWLVSPNVAFVLGADASVTSGEFEPQTSTSAASGFYEFGIVSPEAHGVDYSSGILDFTSATISGSRDDNIGALAADQNIGSLNYTIDSTGLGLVSLPGAASGCVVGATGPGGCQLIFLVISANRAVLLPLLDDQGNPETHAAIRIADQ